MLIMPPPPKKKTLPRKKETVLRIVASDVAGKMMATCMSMSSLQKPPSDGRLARMLSQVSQVDARNLRASTLLESA